MKALITGVLGQDGAYLAKLLLTKGYEVHGLIRRYSTVPMANIEYTGVKDRIELVEADMTDEASIRELIKEGQYQEVYNLAAQSFVSSSWAMPQYTFQTNAMGVLYLVKAIQEYSPDTKIYQASTSEMFGTSNTNGIQDERTPFNPRSPYAIAKLAAYHITKNYKDKYGLFICNGILFNHESPIRGQQFVTQKIATGVANITKGRQDKLLLGSLEPRRDWGFAGDYVDAMWRMLQQDKPDDYVVGTGENHSVEEFVKEAFACAGIRNWQDYVGFDERFARTNDVLDLKSNPLKAKEVLGWESNTSFKELVAKMVTHAL